MIYLLIDYLRTAFDMRVPPAFGYYSTRMILAALTALFITLLLGPWFINRLSSISKGQVIRTEDVPTLAKKHEGKRDTPTMGGLLILVAMLISMLLWMDPTNIFTLILFITTVVLGALGAVDDYLKLTRRQGVRARFKLITQVGLSLGLALYLLLPDLGLSFSLGGWFHAPVVKEWITIDGTLTEKTLTLQEYATRLFVPFYKGTVLQLTGVFCLLSGLFIIFVVTGFSNAVNLTDGLDGLASGCLIMVASALAIVAFLSNHVQLARYLNILYIEGSGEIAIYLSAFVGACVAFLWYNGYPAQLFMGDTGSLALGGVLGVTAVLLRREFLLALVGGIFVAETLSVILQVGSYRLRNRKRIFLCAPLHHHFEYKGWPESKVVLRFWIIGLLLAIIGVASLKLQ